MVTKFGDLDEYFSPGLELPVRGTVYTVPLPSGELGLWCRRIAQTAGEVSDAATDEELEQAAARARERVAALPPLPGGDNTPFDELMLGTARAEMLANKVPDPYIQFCAQTAYLWIVGGEEAARRYWESGGRPEARGPGNRAQRRAAAKAGGTSTAGAAATPSAASTSGTSTPSRSSRSSRGGRSRGR